MLLHEGIRVDGLPTAPPSRGQGEAKGCKGKGGQVSGLADLPLASGGILSRHTSRQSAMRDEHKGWTR